jgi:hypothetical protein
MNRGEEKTAERAPDHRFRCTSGSAVYGLLVYFNHDGRVAGCARVRENQSALRGRV